MDPDDRITPLMKIFGPNDSKIQFELISYFGDFGNFGEIEQSPNFIKSTASGKIFTTYSTKDAVF